MVGGVSSDEKEDHPLFVDQPGVFGDPLCGGIYLADQGDGGEKRRDPDQVANLYMEEINAQLKRHFDSLVEVQLSQVEGITLAVPPSSVSVMDEQAIQDLTASGQSRDFPYLALYNTEGKADIIYGEPVTIREEDAFLES